MSDVQALVACARRSLCGVRSGMDTIGFLSAQALGRVGKYGVLLKQQDPACVSFLLNVPKRGRDGSIYMARIPVEIYGKRASEAAGLTAGQWVHVEGELR